MGFGGDITYSVWAGAVIHHTKVRIQPVRGGGKRTTRAGGVIQGKRSEKEKLPISQMAKKFT